MSNIKKRQHYVWRQYLRGWTNDEYIWTYFKELDKIERPNLMGVAQEKYFYKLSDFTDKEEIFLKLFIESLATDLKEYNLEFFQIFTTTSRLKKQLANTKDTFIDKSIIAEEIRKLEINLMEDAHCQTEGLGAKLISYKSLEDLKTILEDDYIYDAMMFLCSQYYRTRSMRNSVINGLKGKKHELIMEKAWHIVSHSLGIVLAKRISFHPNLKFLFLENDTGEHFIVGDQPVFNMLKEQKNEKGEVQDLELYYPLSPSHALCIHFRTTQKDQFEKQNVDKDEVNYFNRKIFENSEFYVFADTKKQLESLRK